MVSLLFHTSVSINVPNLHSRKRQMTRDESHIKLAVISQPGGIVVNTFCCGGKPFLSLLYVAVKVKVGWGSNLKLFSRMYLLFFRMV